MDTLPLAAALKDLREALLQVHKEGEGKGIKLAISDAEIELQLVATRGGDVGGEIKVGWGLLTAGAKAGGSINDSEIQKVKLKLLPVDAETGEPLTVSRTGGRPR
ncbi:MAG: trypco2 family protein [Pseudomonadota bacterium]